MAVLEVLATVIRQQRAMKGIQAEEEGVSLFANVMCIENSKKSMKKLLQLIREFRKVAEYKVSRKRPTTFFYTSHNQWESEILIFYL